MKQHLPILALLLLFAFLAIRHSPSAFPQQPGAEVSTRSPASPSRPLTAAGPSPVGACQGDLTGDRAVTGEDLQILLANFGRSECSITAGDLNDDAMVDAIDLSVLLATFGCYEWERGSASLTEPEDPIPEELQPWRPGSFTAETAEHAEEGARR